MLVNRRSSNKLDFRRLDRLSGLYIVVFEVEAEGEELSSVNTFCWTFKTNSPFEVLVVRHEDLQAWVRFFNLNQFLF